MSNSPSKSRQMIHNCYSYSKSGFHYQAGLVNVEYHLSHHSCILIVDHWAGKRSSLHETIGQWVDASLSSLSWTMSHKWNKSIEYTARQILHTMTLTISYSLIQLKSHKIARIRDQHTNLSFIFPCLNQDSTILWRADMPLRAIGCFGCSGYFSQELKISNIK